MLCFVVIYLDYSCLFYICFNGTEIFGNTRGFKVHIVCERTTEHIRFCSCRGFRHQNIQAFLFSAVIFSIPNWRMHQHHVIKWFNQSISNTRLININWNLLNIVFDEYISRQFWLTLTLKIAKCLYSTFMYSRQIDLEENELCSKKSAEAACFSCTDNAFPLNSSLSLSLSLSTLL